MQATAVRSKNSAGEVILAKLKIRDSLPLVNDSFESLMPYVPGKPVSEVERELGIKGCVKLASNENPRGPSPRAMEAMRAAIEKANDYPDGSAFYLKKRLARHLGVTPQHLIVGAGSCEVIEMLVRTCIRPDENAVNAWPSFIAYKLLMHAASVQMRDIPLKDMRYDLPALRKAVNEKTKLIFIANPNNPTGTYLTKGEISSFMRDLPPDVLVVLDEAYHEYATAPDYPDGLELLGERERFIVLRTFSKCYGLAGLRIGYGVANIRLIDYLNRGRRPFNVNAVAQAAALAALDDQEHVRTSREMNRREMDRVVSELRGLGLKVPDSQANFILVDFGRDDRKVFKDMLKHGVIVRPMGNYSLITSVRVTIGTPQQNDKFLAAVRKLRPAKSVKRS